MIQPLKRRHCESWGPSSNESTPNCPDAIGAEFARCIQERPAKQEDWDSEDWPIRDKPQGNSEARVCRTASTFAPSRRRDALIKAAPSMPIRARWMATRDSGWILRRRRLASLPTPRRQARGALQVPWPSASSVCSRTSPLRTTRTRSRRGFCKLARRIVGAALCLVYVSRPSRHVQRRAGRRQVGFDFAGTLQASSACGLNSAARSDGTTVRDEFREIGRAHV